MVPALSYFIFAVFMVINTFAFYCLYLVRSAIGGIPASVDVRIAGGNRYRLSPSGLTVTERVGCCGAAISTICSPMTGTKSYLRGTAKSQDRKQKGNGMCWPK